MALPHAQPGQAVDLRPLGLQLATTRTHALFKSQHLEVIRLVLQAGQTLPVHHVPGEITVHCLEGCVELTTEAQAHRLQAGELLFLPGGVPHGVRALADSSALVTMALR
jgi:quercetin dioxygenase-like cupin family protein